MKNNVIKSFQLFNESHLLGNLEPGSVQVFIESVEDVDGAPLEWDEEAITSFVTVPEALVQYSIDEAEYTASHCVGDTKIPQTVFDIIKEVYGEITDHFPGKRMYIFQEDRAAETPFIHIRLCDAETLRIKVRSAVDEKQRNFYLVPVSAFFDFLTELKKSL